MSESETVAVLGAGGTMGKAMARNIAAAGITVRAWNRSSEKIAALADEGIAVCDTPAQACEGASVILTMLSDADAVVDAIERALEGLDSPDAGAAGDAPGERPLLWLQMSTIGIEATERCDQIARERAVMLVDAPVLGTLKPAQEGQLVVMASGPDRAHGRLEGIFAAIGKRTMWVGEAGAATRLKLVTNCWLVAVVEGTAETIALAEGIGVDPRQFLEAVSEGPLDMDYMRLKARMMLDRDFTPSFALRLAAKDASLALQAGERHDLTLPLLATVASRLAEGAREAGDQDFSATFLTSAP